MVDEVMNVPGFELMQDRYRHGPVGHCGQKTDGPVHLVARADGNLVTLVQEAFLESYVQFLNASCHIPVAEADSLIVREGKPVPILSEAFLQKLVH